MAKRKRNEPIDEPEVPLEGAGEGFVGSSPTGADGAEAEEIDPRDAEITKLREENAALKKAAARAGDGPPPGKYDVSLKDGPRAVVECQPGEHPFDAFKRVTGVLHSANAPEVKRVKDDARCGICDHTGKVPEPKA